MAAQDTLYERRRPHGREGMHTLSVLVENKPGVLARIAGMFARRGFNIESLAVGPTEDPKVSRMTIVVKVEAKPVQQIIRQLEKLVSVVHIEEIPSHVAVERELVLVKVDAGPGDRSQILEIADIFRAKIVDVHAEAVTLEATGTADKVRALIDILRPYGIRETARTGLIALDRGQQTIEDAYLSVIRSEQHEEYDETA